MNATDKTAARRKLAEAVDLTKAAYKISQVSAALMLEQPFYSTLRGRMPWVWNCDIPTMRTNGLRIEANPLFVDELDINELKFVVCHEVLHSVLQHATRRGARSPSRWNIAGDYIINDILLREQIGEMPRLHEGLVNPSLVQAGLTTDGVYALLSDEGEDQGDQPRDSDDLEDAPGDEAAQAQQEAETQVAVAQAAQAARMRGGLSPDMARLVDQVLRPRVDWVEVLRRFVDQRAKTESSFARPRRRADGDFSDLILPGRGGETMGRVVFAVDCSGSIGEAELNQAAGEIIAVHEDVHPEILDVIYWDTKVQHHDVFRPDDAVTVSPHGGGGTRFAPVVAYIDEHLPEPPVCMVVLTDLEISDFGPAPAYPVLWLSTHAKTAPWGEVTMLHGG